MLLFGILGSNAMTFKTPFGHENKLRELLVDVCGVTGRESFP